MKNMHRFMGIDLGTTAVKCLVLNEKGETLAQSSKSYERITNKKNWIEQDPNDWWRATSEGIRECVKILGTGEIDAISFSGHMSAPVFLGKQGEVLYNSILIADTRSTKQTRFLAENYGTRFREITGNTPIDAFTASKLLWFKENEAQLYQKLATFIFPKDYIRYKLTGVLGTDATDAGNSLLYNYQKQTWERELIEELGLDMKIFPEVSHSLDICGGVSKEASHATNLRYGTRVIMGAADMACSQIGSGAIKEHVTAITLSTSIQVVRTIKQFQEGLRDKMTYHQSIMPKQMYTMSSIFSGGYAVDWAYKFLFNKEQMVVQDFEDINQKTKGMISNLLFIPFLTGSGSPYFQKEDAAGWYGLRPSTDKMEAIAAVFEGITYNIRDNMEILEDALGDSETIYIAGGGSRYEAWPQIIANVLKKPVKVLKNRDASGLGAAILAGTGAEVFTSVEECFQEFNQVEMVVEPEAKQMEIYDAAYRRYQTVYQAVQKL